MLENRQKVTITGVQDVDSFDEATVLLATDFGYITLHGVDLHISKLNLEEGQLLVEGEIIALQYSDADYSKGKGEDCSAGCLDKGLPMIMTASNQAYIFLTTV